MKGRVKITKIQLDDKPIEEYTFLGIVSTEADYKLSQSLNKKLRIALKNITPVQVTGVTGSINNFSRFSYTSGHPDVTYNLISNKSDKDYILKKLKNIDYFFQVHSIDNEYDVEQLTSTLREIERITAVFRLDPRKINDKNLLYLDL